ncbi:glycosyltransferase family 4 protein [Mucilaginibacter jinjuensis]|uniref:Glycosyltransferase family 4 protein n=1 Tax=Mucilaginibacter jinjuensis TaxID=1176721 RepID=A0ABY7TBF0_9SPHI|nr:glycosyltransferase family 4 protein [Mucilaginibacter jinjuensis]WCT13835.1 glycosyltransferase family 4 protein [Mucilaginibacter jinjuensis]
MKDVIFINSHPIQYFAPLYKYLNQHGVKTAAWYGSDESIKGGLDKQFGVEIKWDVPLLEGYEYRFFKNNSWKPSHFNGFFGLLSFEMVKAIFKAPKSVVIVHGYHYATHLLILLLAGLRGHTVCLRNETPYSHERGKANWKQKLKYFFLKNILFPRADVFLYIGEQNRLFYKSYNIDDSKLIYCPYAVDNDRFASEFTRLRGSVVDIRKKMGIGADDKVILYSGKYIDKKRPMDLLKAFKNIAKKDCWLIMVGEGQLRGKLEQFVTDYDLKNVILTGFVNQSQISEYYAIADVFVMCSGVGETWGLSVNEAMNFNMPIILSDLTGSSSDLVKDSINGYKFKTGDEEELARRLDDVLYENKLTRTLSSKDVINKYSYAIIAENLSLLTK